MSDESEHPYVEGYLRGIKLAKDAEGRAIELPQEVISRSENDETYGAGVMQGIGDTRDGHNQGEGIKKP